MYIKAEVYKRTCYVCNDMFCPFKSQAPPTPPSTTKANRFMCSMKKTLLIIRGMETSVPLETVHAIHCPYARHCAGVHYKHCVLAFIESRP